MRHKKTSKTTIEIPGIAFSTFSNRDDQKPGTWEVRPIETDRNGKGFEIDLTQMYDAPTASLDMLLLLADHFGTQRIDLDDISEDGCESCDYGSRYGYTVQVFGATKNVPDFK